VINIKTCSKCGHEKELSGFYSYNKTKKDGTEYTYYYPYCKECASNKSYQWALDNPEKYKKSRHKYNKSEKSRKHFYEFGKQYREDGRRKEWEQNNKDKLKQYGLNHIHKTHDITDDEINQLYEYCNASCMYCGMAEEEHKEIYGQKLHKDHAYNEGSNGIDNCILACKSCNSSKRGNDWNEWYAPENPRYSEEKFLRITQWLDEFH
jgi:hypothetical protein